ncbi:unnamed protein product [Cyclocybe aegerita]|uniref:HNH nuclease domain-containing protein n=1 Tax=Cyclocybe aegerita TaxID=1973307 RepID=A0A8S0X2L8_CYCAE|nr:unnamed protein product [Cyclocybe aegerita]
MAALPGPVAVPAVAVPFPPAPVPVRQPLPPNPYIEAIQPACHSAYDQCLQAEQAAGGDSQFLMHARCLGYLIREAPDDEARCHVSEEILLCNGNPKSLNLLAKFYIEHLFRLFRQNKGRTPGASHHPSRPSFEEERFFFSSTVDSAPKDHTAAKKAALRRDNYRCMVSGDADLNSLTNMTDDERAALNFTGVFESSETNFCHIFPPSTNWDLKPEDIGHPKTHYSGNVWGIVNCFGGINVLDELTGDMAHRLSNGLTMSVALHGYFDRLALWFEEVPNNPHTYRVRTLLPNLRGLSQLGPHPVVTFTTTTNLELPDPKYLRLHAAVCRVAHMSSAAKYLDLYDRELEERKALARDGSSAELLSTQLRRALLTRVGA